MTHNDPSPKDRVDINGLPNQTVKFELAQKVFPYCYYVVQTQFESKRIVVKSLVKDNVRDFAVTRATGFAESSS